jgi:very-short-patch-repair endonuclease
MTSTTPRWRASTEMQQRARELRREMTPAERRLWQYLRNDQLDGAISASSMPSTLSLSISSAPSPNS